jgi:hypothetical protein
MKNNLFDYHQYISLKPNKNSLLEKFEFLKNSGLKEYENEVCSLFGLKQLPIRNDHNIIEQIIPKSLEDYEKKERDRLYYISNVICFWIS